MARKAVIATLVAALSGGIVAAPASGSLGDPYFSAQWGLTRIRADQAWSVATGAGVTIAVVDSGVDLGHPDLASKLVVHPDADLVDPKGECADSVCVQDGPQDEDGHGTHVAGIAAAATNNGIGVAGVAPDAAILPVRVLDGGDNTTARLAAGIRYAADKGVRVVNLSIAYSPPGHVDSITGALRPVHEAIAYALGRGAVVVVAAGNDSLPLCSEPAAVAGVLCVGAVDRADRPAYYTNFDSTMSKRFLVAPGGDDTISCANDVFSTYLRGASNGCSTADGYDAAAGTSMAAPFVSGVAALLAQRGMAADAIVACILSTTDDLGPPGRDPVFGYGRVNALKAVTGC
ncbi:MAG: S8 family serine peptidase [Actinomycetota bacterium]|nr:S8 family serine peptidase [Actinomycetota bacterium]